LNGGLRHDAGVRLSREDCRERCAAAEHAVLAVNDADGPPLAVPITFAVLQGHGAGAEVDAVVFAVDHKPKTTTRLRRLDLIQADARVAVLVEHYEGDWGLLWWVRADGVAEILPPGEREDERMACLAVLTAKYPQYAALPPRAEIVRIQVRRWSGWSGADLSEPPAT
jgi:PPOX class probable F420-dependent enzyme